MTLQRYKLTIAYDGSAFHGWQQQEPPGEAPLRTVAGELQTTLTRVLRQPITLRGASRTDAGVHAMGQVAAFNAELSIPLERLAQAINSRLPEDIEVRRAEVVDPSFDPALDPISKQYRYRIWNTSLRPLTLRQTVYHCWLQLDATLMQEAAKRLIGTHDFAGLASAHHGRLHTVRTIHDCRIEQHDPELHIVVSGSGFLYNMVRIIAGTLVDVGRGHTPPDRIEEILSTQNRRLAGPTLPPTGLCLEWIRYPNVEREAEDVTTEEDS